MNDQRDWSEVQVGNPAFDSLFQLDKPFFRTVCRQLSVHLAQMGVPPCERDDLIDEALLKAVKHRHRFVGDELERRVLCWLRKTIHRLALDRVRRLARRFCEALDAGMEEMIDEREAKRAVMAEMSEEVKTMLENVGPGNVTSARLLLGHFLQGYSILELAQLFGMTAKSVDGRIRRLVEQLRKAAEEISRS